MRPTLGQVFALSLLGLAAMLGVLFYFVFHASRATIIESSESLRDAASREIGERVAGFLAKAPEVVQQFQEELDRGLIDARNGQAVEPALFALLLANRDIGEITFTQGDRLGFAPDGAIELADTPRGQWSLGRTPSDGREDRFTIRHVHQEGGAFVSDWREPSGSARFAESPVKRESGAAIADPTLHPTFVTPAREDFHGRLLWSDLHWSQLDAGLPEAQRRVEVSVQQVVNDSTGKFAGVLRVGLLAQQLDRAVLLRLTHGAGDDPQRIFICDSEGRVITRGDRSDRLQEFGDDLRIASDALPEPIANALADSKLRTVGAGKSVSSHFRAAGEDFLATFRGLPATQDWIVGIVVPRAFYTDKLTAMRNRLLAVSLAIIALLVFAGGLILRAVRRAQAQIVTESLKMNAFEFAPAPTASAFRDVTEVLESLEKAKTAMRAMGKFVPIDLVRRLYRERSEPVLGGELIEVSIMFTDIKDFTTFSERLAPNDLAAALGRYLEVMARIIQQETRGTIDKYIGDAIMTLWNAPEPVPDHARLACLAALRCREAGQALAESPEWRGLPAFETRFGLHRDPAMVGHFGAPDRMNYTAIGDAINLCSRLEALNKQYGTTIIASERIVEAAGEAFDFRLLDLVAVKGKNQSIRIYELLGEKGRADERRDAVTAYESAFDAYLRRDFAAAMATLENYPDDPPSAALIKRCRAFQQQPPPPDWRGVHAFTSK